MSRENNLVFIDGARNKKYSRKLHQIKSELNISMPQNHKIHDTMKSQHAHIKEELAEGKSQVSSTDEGDNYMTDYYKALIDRLDQDIRDHKQEMRDRDALYKTEAKEREERYIKLFDEKFKAQNELFQKQFEHINSHLQDIKNEMTNVTNRVDNIHARVDNVKWWIIGSLITLGIGVAGIVYANWQVISSMLSLAQK